MPVGSAAGSLQIAAESTLALLRSMETGAKSSVSLRRVIRQRIAMAELSMAALSEPSLDSILNDACRYAAEGCDARFAKILEHRAEEHAFLVRAGWGWEPGIVGHATAADDATNPAGESFHSRKPVTVLDLKTRDDYRLPPIYRRHRIVSSTNVPIIGSAGFFGVLEVDHPTRRRFDTLDSSLLISIAAIVAESVERTRREGALRAAYNASALLLREHYHRVRNNFQTILALVQLHARETSGDNSRRRIEDIGRRIFSLASLYDHLLGTHASERIEINGYIATLCEKLHGFYRLDDRRVELACRAAPGLAGLDVDTCTTLGIVINELVANAMEHAFTERGGRIEIVAEAADSGQVAIRVEDNGRGFQGPSTGSIGLAVARRLMSWIGGSLSLKAGPEGGTSWTLLAPRTRASAAPKPEPPVS
jgi:two-component sensor histidine kinase